MSTNAASAEPVRRALLIRTALQVLAETRFPIQRAEVLRRVGMRLEFTDYELEPFREGSSQSRWENHLSWASTDMKAAGWIDKTAAGWAITDAGREALVTHPDGLGLEVDSARA
ncbi:MAG: hypothetical protein GX454_00915 [Brooklawnia sp.]|nr:hypothetical protein [Brooklawnia sp.]